MSEFTALAASTPSTPRVSTSPVTLPFASRAVDLEVRVTVPIRGEALPIILLSHGSGRSNFIASYRGYGPLVDFWASHGFAVLQPTHLDTATYDTRGADDPEAPLYPASRARDMTFLLDHLDDIESAVPEARGRLDHSAVAVVGHSMGGHTASVLLGARFTDPASGAEMDLRDPRIAAGVLLAAPGRGGEALTSFAADNYSFFSTTDFTHMAAPALVVVGDQDASPMLTVTGPSWHADGYRLAPAPKTLLTLFRGGHMLGGVSGWDAKETDDEDPERVEAVQWSTWGWLRSRLRGDAAAWDAVQTALAMPAEPQGRIESR